MHHAHDEPSMDDQNTHEDWVTTPSAPCGSPLRLATRNFGNKLLESLTKPYATHDARTPFVNPYAVPGPFKRITAYGFSHN